MALDQMKQGFREFRVADKVAEGDIIMSFYLEPTDGAPVWEVKPGQYLIPMCTWDCIFLDAKLFHIW